MRDVEQLLRDTLEARAAQVEPRPDVESVLERAARRRSSRTWTAGLVLTAMLLAVVVIPVLLLDRDQQVILEPPEPPESAEPTAPSQSVPSEAAVDVLPVDGSYVYANGVAITGDRGDRGRGLHRGGRQRARPPQPVPSGRDVPVRSGRSRRSSGVKRTPRRR